MRCACFFVGEGNFSISVKSQWNNVIHIYACMIIDPCLITCLLKLFILYYCIMLFITMLDLFINTMLTKCYR